VSRIVLHVRADQPGATVSRQVFGHFIEHLGTCIYGGLWVGADSPVPNTGGWRQDAVEALRAMGTPNIRWPGGCFADDYHWRDGTGPAARRPRGVSAWWGAPESNAVGIHEFLDLCAAVGAEPYICGNVGSGTVQEMRDWVEYLNAPAGASALAELRAAHGRTDPARVRLWAVGNESWACGGNMRAEYYADLYRRFATFLRDFPGAPLYRVGCGPRDDDYHWTEVMMRECGRPLLGGQRLLQGLALHCYCVPGDFPPLKSATTFGETEWDELMALTARLGEYIASHAAIMDRYDPEKHVALVVDEWGAWHAPEPGTPPGHFFQQGTVRDAVMAGYALNLFIRHADRVRLANLAQAANVVHAALLIRDGQLLRTPTWDVFTLYRAHQDGVQLPVELDAGLRRWGDLVYPRVSAAASRAADGRITVTICNLDYAAAISLTLQLPGVSATRAEGRILSAGQPQAHNSFSQPDAVRACAFTAVQPAAGGWELTLPPHSVLALTFA
jgi:alpha-N-arabinofuranosidase